MKYVHFFSLILFSLIVVHFGCQKESNVGVQKIEVDNNDLASFQKEVLQSLPFDDSIDFLNANRGFIATRQDPVIRNEDGSMAFDLNQFNFMDGPAPQTVNPSLWRQGQLNKISGLFKVCEGIYQVRGFDLANMTMVASDNGWIVIDPLTTEAAAKAAMDLTSEHLGNRPIRAVIFTHSHIDHFGGIKGIVSEKDVVEKEIEIIAPEGFFESAISENIIAGNGMLRRATYMFGQLLPRDANGFVGSGLGQSVSTGRYGILKPTITISETGQKLTVDGLEIVFQNTPEAEAPAEFMFYFPKYKAFCQSEEINHTMHNLYTLRGAHVRNGLKWSKYVDESIQLFGDEVEISFGSHHWPTWDKDQILELWSKQRDMYKFIHDETLHLANKGYTMLEIAETIELPPSLDRFFANRGYYGTLSHNAKAQYQLYYGWFDANPAHLHALPPKEASEKYVSYMGGADSILIRVKSDISNGDFRWAAMVLNHVIFADPQNDQARQLLAEVYSQMGYRAESGPWRNFYLTGAQELQRGIVTEHLKGVSKSDDILINLSLEHFYDYMAVRLDRTKTNGKEYTFNLVFPDINEHISIYLVNDVLHNRPGVLAENPNATITMKKSTFNDIITQKSTGLAKLLAKEIKIEGSRSDYSDFQKMVETPFDLLFNIVEP
jgi:alkyl sulfatase BDS1-like metallo-beta-lactamase superfamily hydrolase